MNQTAKSGLVIAATALVIGGAFYLRSQNAVVPEPAAASAPATNLRTAPQEMPVLVELGSDKCVSCKAMVPVLEELESTHANALEVRFIDVWKDPDSADKYDVQIIPTQVLLAPDARELTRHTGFWSADSIRQAFAEHGYVLAAAGANP